MEPPPPPRQDGAAPIAPAAPTVQGPSVSTFMATAAMAEAAAAKTSRFGGTHQSWWPHSLRVLAVSHSTTQDPRSRSGSPLGVGVGAGAGLHLARSRSPAAPPWWDHRQQSSAIAAKPQAWVHSTGHLDALPGPDEDDEDDMTLPVNLAAGAVAGFVAETAMHPFETVSTRAKVHPTSAYGGFLGAAGLIYREEGLRGLTAGVSVTMLASAPCTAVYFAAYESVKRVGLKHCPEGWEPLVHFGAGAASELGSSLLFVPADVVRSRLQLGVNPSRATGGLVSATRNYPSIYRAFSSIARQEGMAGLFAGWRSCLLQDCAFSAMQFLVYEEYGRLFRASHKRELTAYDTMWAGATAGGIAALVTNPLDLITTRLMAQGADRRFGTGVVSCLRQAWREGPMGLWRGSAMRVMATAPAAAITFTCYEAAKRFLGPGASAASSTVGDGSGAGSDGAGGAKQGQSKW